MKKATQITGVILAAVISSNAFATDSGDNLVEPRKNYFDEVLVGELGRLDGATEVFIAPLVTENVVVHEPSSSANYRRPFNDFILENDEQLAIQGMYYEAMERKFESEGMIVVDRVNQDTIVVQAALTELFPVAPKDDARNRQIADTYYTEGAGEARIELEVSLDDEVLMTAMDKRDMGHRWQENDRFHNKIEFRRVLTSWANALMKQINI